MTKDEIIEMARTVGLPHWYQTKEVVNIELLERFVKLVVQRDRANILAVIGDNQCECRCSEVVRDGGLL